MQPVTLRRFTLFGILGALFYITHVILGGFLWKGYNHLMQPISDLTAAGAPHRELLLALTNLYGICSLVFIFSAFFLLRTRANKTVVLGIICFFIVQAVSMMYGFFPEDLPGSPATFGGIMHIVVTALIVPFTIASPILVGVGYMKTSAKNYGIYSLITGIIIFIFGGLSAVFFINKLPYFGLVERINIGSLQLWMLVFSIKWSRTNLGREF